MPESHFRDVLAGKNPMSLIWPSPATGDVVEKNVISGKQVGLLKEIVPRLSHIVVVGIPELNAAQFTATETAVRSLALEAEIMGVRTANNFEPALALAKTRQVGAGILLSSPLVFNSPSKSASLRWPNGSPSFPCSLSFQNPAASLLTGRT